MTSHERLRSYRKQNGSIWPTAAQYRRLMKKANKRQDYDW